MNIINISCEAIIAEYSDLVYRIAITGVKNKEDAEDIFQEVFISLMKHLDKIEDETHLKHWLIRATINRSKNHYLCFWKRKVELSQDEMNSQYASTYDDNFVVQEVRQQILALPPKFRSAVYLYYFEEYSTNEISEILKLPVGTVKSRLHKARSILKDKLKEVRSNGYETY